ncbi:MAG: amidohydrolase [Chloroflexi bacterium]|nr:amidohydrolase [Chloroflexota bacterium]
MNIIDSHVHTSPYWGEPIEVILCLMDRNKVDKATLVQYEEQMDNQYLLDCARRFPGRFSPIVFVDTKRSDAPRILNDLVKQGAEGVRLHFSARSPGHDSLAIWRACAELNLPISCCGKAADYASEGFRELIEAVPGLTILIEHLGQPPKKDPPPYETYRKVLSLSRHPGIYLKVGGLGELCDRPKPFRQPYPFENVPPFVRMAYEAFGANRMMWASTCPSIGHREGYTNGVRYLAEHLAGFSSETDRQWIFGKTALSLFKFGQK